MKLKFVKAQIAHLFPIAMKQENGERGIVLIIVLWVMVILSVIVGQFNYSIRNEINTTRNFRDKTKSYYFARAGVNKAIQLLLSAPAIDGSNDEDKEIVRINVANPPVEFGEGRFEIKIANESGKININTAGKKLLELMVSDLDITDSEAKTIVDSIRDWRDKDSFHRMNGAEDDYYERLPEPYSCSDGPFLSANDLLLVKGISKEIFKVIQDRITIFPIIFNEEKQQNSKKGKSKSSQGPQEQTKVNINAAPAAILALLSDMDEATINSIKEYRQSSDFKSISEFKDVVGNDQFIAISPFITLKTSQYYSIKSKGSISGSRASHTVFTIVKINLKSLHYSFVWWQDSVTSK